MNMNIKLPDSTDGSLRVLISQLLNKLLFWFYFLEKSYSSNTQFINGIF